MKRITAFLLITVLTFAFIPVYAARGGSEIINVTLLGEDFNSLSDQTVSSAAVKIAKSGGFTQIRPREDSQLEDKALFMGWESGNNAGVGYVDINIPEIKEGSCSFEFDLYLDGTSGDYSRLYIGENPDNSHILSFAGNKIGSFISLPQSEWSRLRLDVNFSEKNSDGIPFKWYIKDGGGFVFKKTIFTKDFETLKFLRLRPYFNSDNEGFFGLDNVKYTVKKSKGTIISVNDGSQVSHSQPQLSFKMDNLPENLTKEHISIKSLYTSINAQSIEINNETKSVSCIFEEDIKSATEYTLTIDKAAYCSEDVTSDVTMNFTTSDAQIDVKEPEFNSGTITVDVVNNSGSSREYNVFVVIYKNGIIDGLRSVPGVAPAGDSAPVNASISGLPTSSEYSYKVFVANGWMDKSIFVDKVWNINR